MTEILYLVGLMSFWIPPHAHDESRYQQIAQDALNVGREQRILDGLTGAEQAAVILTVASYESGFSRAMDEGRKRGDGGESVCLGGIRVRYDVRLRERIAHDRKECFRRILKRVKYSWTECAKMPFDDRLSKYIVGKCVRNDYSRRYSARIMDSFAGLTELFGEPE